MIARNLARLKLKEVVDAADATETMEFYNVILLQMQAVVVAVSCNPREEAYEQCLNILKRSIFPILFEELIKRACERNSRVAEYIGNVHKLEYNKKLRPILDMLLNHSRIRQVKMKPYVLQHIQEDQETEKEASSELETAASDLSDPSDLGIETYAKNSDEKISQESLGR